MLAHRVLADIERQINGEQIDHKRAGKNYVEYLRLIRKPLIESVKFRMPELNAFSKFTEPLYDDFIGGKLDDYIKAPSHTTWFEYDYEPENKAVEFKDSPTYRGVLVTDHGDRVYSSFVFNYFPTFDFWALLPSVYFTSVGCDIIENAAYMKSKNRNMLEFAKLDVGDRAFLMPISQDMANDKDFEKQMKLEVGALSEYALLSMIVLNTRNVEVKTIGPPKKLNKKRVSRGKYPIFSYKVLAIDLSGGSRIAEGRKAGATGLTRLHFCRGHIKNFTEEKPLFGKVTGPVWWQPQIRGNKKRGAVLKDYQVN